MIILDTNIVSELMRDRPEGRLIAWMNAQPRLSIWTTAVTIMESRVGLVAMPPGRRREAMTSAFEQFLARDIDQRVLPFDQPAAETTAVLLADHQARGRSIELRDGMIAGIALTQRASLATRDTRHFKDLGIVLIDP